MDKFKISKKIKYMVIIISLIALISGVLFTYVLKDADKEALTGSIKGFIDSISTNTYSFKSFLKSHLFVNISYIVIVWILSISIVGFPIIGFLYFIKVFTLGITISGLIGEFGRKGIIYSFIYVFPHNIINIILFAVISIHSIIYSVKIAKKFLKKESIDFKNNTYDKKLILICLLGVIVTSLYSTYIMPYIFKILLKIMK